MNRFKSIILNFLLGSILISCQPKAKLCPNSRFLYPSPDSIYPVFDLSKGNEAFYAFMDSLVEVFHQEEVANSDGLFILRDSMDYLCKMNPIEYWDEPPPCISGRNFMEVKIDDQGRILEEDKVKRVIDIKSLWKTFQTNEGMDPNLSMSSGKSWLEIRIDTGFQMDTLIQVLFNVQEGRNEIIKEYAERKYDTTFCALPLETANTIIERYPMHILISRKEKGWFEIPPPPPLPIIGNEG